MRNFPIGRYPLAETVWRLVQMEQFGPVRVACASYACAVDKERADAGIPSAFAYPLSKEEIAITNLLAR